MVNHHKKILTWDNIYLYICFFPTALSKSKKSVLYKGLFQGSLFQVMYDKASADGQFLVCAS